MALREVPPLEAIDEKPWGWSRHSIRPEWNIRPHDCELVSSRQRPLRNSWRNFVSVLAKRKTMIAHLRQGKNNFRKEPKQETAENLLLKKLSWEFFSAESSASKFKVEKQIKRAWESILWSKVSKIKWIPKSCGIWGCFKALILARASSPMILFNPGAVAGAWFFQMSMLVTSSGWFVRCIPASSAKSINQSSKVLLSHKRTNELEVTEKFTLTFSDQRWRFFLNNFQTRHSLQFRFFRIGECRSSGQNLIRRSGKLSLSSKSQEVLPVFQTGFVSVLHSPAVVFDFVNVPMLKRLAQPPSLLPSHLAHHFGSLIHGIFPPRQNWDVFCLKYNNKMMTLPSHDVIFGSVSVCFALGNLPIVDSNPHEYASILYWTASGVVQKPLQVALRRTHS